MNTLRECPEQTRAKKRRGTLMQEEVFDMVKRQLEEWKHVVE